MRVGFSIKWQSSRAEMAMISWEGPARVRRATQYHRMSAKSLNLKLRPELVEIRVDYRFPTKYWPRNIDDRIIEVYLFLFCPKQREASGFFVPYARVSATYNIRNKIVKLGI